jgi:hypothetical protein
MNEPEHLALVHRWLRYAREDLLAAEAMLVNKAFGPAMLVGWRNKLPKKH